MGLGEDLQFVQTSAFLQRPAKLLPVLGVIQTAKVLRIQFTGLDLQIDKDRPVFLKNGVELAVPIFQVGDLVGFGLTGGCGQIGKANRSGTRNRHGAVGFVGAIFAETMDQVFRRRIGDGH